MQKKSPSIFWPRPFPFVMLKCTVISPCQVNNSQHSVSALFLTNMPHTQHPTPATVMTWKFSATSFEVQQVSDRRLLRNKVTVSGICPLHPPPYGSTLSPPLKMCARSLKLPFPAPCSFTYTYVISTLLLASIALVCAPSLVTLEINFLLMKLSLS